MKLKNFAELFYPVCREDLSDRTQLQRQRRAGQGRCLSHSFVGMLVAWFITQIVVVIVSSMMMATNSLEGGAGAKALLLFYAMIVFTIWSLAICLVAWLVIGLPVYWFIPRLGIVWNPVCFTLIGFLAGAAVCARGHFERDAWFMGISGTIGAMCAFMSWWMEERMLKRMLPMKASMSDG